MFSPGDIVQHNGARWAVMGRAKTDIPPERVWRIRDAARPK
jgi:hypothetical protein